MQSTISAAAFLALVSSVLAQTEGFDAITAPTKDQTVQAGQVCVITWDASPEYNEDTVTIRLMQGADEGSLDFNPTDIAGNISSSLGSYSWTVDSSLGDYATYGLKIELDTDNDIYQYSNPFHIEGSTTSSSTAAPVSSTASTSSVSSSSSSPASSSVATTSSSGSAAVTTATTSSAASSGTLVPTSGSGNLSTTGSGASQTTLTRATSGSPTGSATATTTPVQTAAAGKIAAGTLAAIGGVFVAVLAL